MNPKKKMTSVVVLAVVTVLLAVIPFGLGVSEIATANPAVAATLQTVFSSLSLFCAVAGGVVLGGLLLGGSSD